MLLRIMKKDGKLILLLFLSIIVMLLCNMEIKISCSVKWIEFGKNVFYSIAGGYIAGYIFYFFSVSIPQLKRQIPILKVVSQHLIYSKSELMDLSSSICDTSEIKDTSFRNKLASKISEDNYQISQKNCQLIALAMFNIKKLIESPSSIYEVLELNDLNNICEINRITTKIYTQVTDVMPNPLYLSMKDYCKFVNSILEVYNLLEDVYVSIEKML